MKKNCALQTIRKASLAIAVLAAGLAHAIGIPSQGTWETTLQPRELDSNLLNGPDAFYDTALNITWLRNANVNGPNIWFVANTWANNLNVGGYVGWRLPTALNVDGTGPCAGILCDNSEMGHLYYVTLGNTSAGLSNTGDFQSIQTDPYWSGTQYGFPPPPALPSYAWVFYNFYGTQFNQLKDGVFYSMAVHNGDVGNALPVAEPQTLALMLLGVAALSAMKF